MAKPDTTSAWSFSKLHEPNCDGITNQELFDSFISRWPADPDGITRIPYTFSSPSFWTMPTLFKYINLGLRTLNELQPDYQSDVKTNLKLGLKNWEQSSGGKIQFHEASLGPHSKGISFYLADFTAMLEAGFVGLTHLKTDNNGYLSQAAVILPEDRLFWDMSQNKLPIRAKNFRIVEHELGHTLGLGHLHNEGVLTKLQEMLYGSFCSVMPYAFKVNKFKKYAANEIEGIPIPGELDERSIDLNYADENVPEVDSSFIDLNIKCAFINSTMIAGFYESVHVFVSNLQNPKTHNPLLTNEQAQLVVDGIFLGAMLYLRFPVTTTTLFVANSILKYIPEKWLDYLPFHLNQWLHNKLTPAIVGTALALREGGTLTPMLKTVLASEIGSFFGTMTGFFPGKISAGIINKILNCCMWCISGYQPSEKNDELNAQTTEGLFHEDSAKNSNDDISNEMSTNQLIDDRRKQRLFSSMHTFFNNAQSIPNVENRMDAEVVRNQLVA